MVFLIGCPIDSDTGTDGDCAACAISTRSNKVAQHTLVLKRECSTFKRDCPSILGYKSSNVGSAFCSS